MGYGVMFAAFAAFATQATQARTALTRAPTRLYGAAVLSDDVDANVDGKPENPPAKRITSDTFGGFMRWVRELWSN